MPGGEARVTKLPPGIHHDVLSAEASEVKTYRHLGAGLREISSPKRHRESTNSALSLLDGWISRKEWIISGQTGLEP